MIIEWWFSCSLPTGPPARSLGRPLGGWMAAGGRGTTRWVCLLHFFSLTRPFGRQASSPRYYKCYMKLALFNVTFKPPYTVFRNIFSSVSIKYSKDQSIWLESEPFSWTSGGLEGTICYIYGPLCNLSIFFSELQEHWICSFPCCDSLCPKFRQMVSYIWSITPLWQRWIHIWNIQKLD